MWFSISLPPPPSQAPEAVQPRFLVTLELPCKGRTKECPRDAPPLPLTPCHFQGSLEPMLPWVSATPGNQGLLWKASHGPEWAGPPQVGSTVPAAKGRSAQLVHPSPLQKITATDESDKDYHLYYLSSSSQQVCIISGITPFYRSGKWSSQLLSHLPKSYSKWHFKFPWFFFFFNNKKSP